MSDCSETEIRDPCAAGGIHKNIWLSMCQYGGGIGFKTITYPLEIAMNYVAGVEVIDTLSDIR